MPAGIGSSLSIPDISGLEGGKAQARKTAEEFEAIFIAEMLRPVFEELSEQAQFGGGAGEQIMAPLLTDAYGNALAQAGGIGVADTIYAEILRLQGLEP